jgi:predicted transcriptional regulator
MKLSDAEWTVMNAAWEAGPASAREILARVAPETGWAYTTVKTLLDRLVEKGALGVDRRARSSLYAPRVSRGQARRQAVRSLLDRAFDGTFGSLVQHLVEEERLSPRERAAVARLAAGRERQGGRRR